MEAYVLRARARSEQSSEMRTLAEVEECGKSVDDCRKALDLAKKIKPDSEFSMQAKSLSGAGAFRAAIAGRRHSAVRRPDTHPTEVIAEV